MTELFDAVDNYVKLSYVVRRLNAKLNRLPDFIFSSSVECDYKSLGIDDEIISILDESTSLREVEECYKQLEIKSSTMRDEIYDTIFKLSLEDKQKMYDYVTSQSFTITLEAENILAAYLRTVQEIEAATKSENAEAIRLLGKIAKNQYSKYYELDAIKNAYTYLGCYMSSMVGRKLGKK